MKQQTRKFRVLRLLAVVQAYHYYTMLHLESEVLKNENNWLEAEHLSHWANILMPYKESSPTDFIHNKKELTDTILDNYDEFKKWLKIAESAGITEKTLTAFCKNVDNLQSVFTLKVFGHIFYPEWLIALFLYLHNELTKTELQTIMVEYSLFSGKPKPANFSEFRKTMIEIEQLLTEITNKQILREIKKCR
jgi:hypothetical protein